MSHCPVFMIVIVTSRTHDSPLPLRERVARGVLPTRRETGEG